MARTKRIRFTKYELKLLLHPPTEGTWICPSHKKDDGTTFTIINSASQKSCWLCHKNKPQRAKKPWKDYVLACDKLGIEPGTPGFVVEKLMKRKEEDRRNGL